MPASTGPTKTPNPTPPDTASIAKTVSVIIEYAIASRASDIHIEPRADIVQVRYRIDGLLHETMTLPKAALPIVISHIQDLAHLTKPSGPAVPQEGRFNFKLGERNLLLRVSTLPVIDGEKIVMRILDENAHPLTLEELGLEGENLSRVSSGIHQPHGLILVTGPNGAGKSTTLYSMLTLLNSPGVNISTIEDTVEYRLAETNQTQANAKTGMTLVNGLRSLLTQDPDIIMVSELRDSETADLAVQGSLTGHVVFSAVHTDNAATALSRLLDMGIEPFLVASTIKLVVAQRLARRICQNCKIIYSPNHEELAAIKHDLPLDAALKLLHGDKAAPAPTDNQPVKTVTPTAPEPIAAVSKLKTIQPEHANIMSSHSILERIAADPNIINRSMAETEATAQRPPIEAQPAPTEAPKPAAPAKPRAGELVLYKAGPGCDQCSRNGYLGRIGLFEALTIDDMLTKQIVNRTRADLIEEAATRQGMISMQLDGMLKCLRGETTVEEVLRVTREIDR